MQSVGFLVPARARRTQWEAKWCLLKREVHFRTVRQLAPFGQFGQPTKNLADYVKHIPSAPRRVMRRNPGIRLHKIIHGNLGEKHPVRHSTGLAYAPNLFQSGAVDWTLPASI
jgi:hypothetical protein